VLFSYYGELCPKKKRQYLELYLEENSSLSEIAEKYNTTAEKLAAKNNIKDIHLIYVDQVLVIEGTASTTAPAATTEETAPVATETVEEALVNEETVQFVGWGTFEVKERAARTGINPQTKEEIQIPAKKVVKFKVGKKLADNVAEGK